MNVFSALVQVAQTHSEQWFDFLVALLGFAIVGYCIIVLIIFLCKRLFNYIVGKENK